MSESMPYTPIHPGEMLKDELAARKISQRQFAQTLGISASQLNEILNGKHALTADFALMLEKALGTKAYIWVRLQSDYDLQVAQNNPTTLSRLANIRKIASVL